MGFIIQLELIAMTNSVCRDNVRQKMTDILCVFKKARGTNYRGLE